MTSTWKHQILTADPIKKVGDVYIYHNISTTSDTVWTESTFAKRALVPYSTTWCEQQLGERLLDSSIESSLPDKNGIIMDLGCGDGRYVRYFLEKGYSKIIALNYEIEPLLLLERNLSKEEKQKVLLICGDVLTTPLVQGSADYILAWGLFSSTPDFSRTLNHCVSLLKPEHYMFNAEPILEQSLVYALVMNDPDEFLRMLTTKTRPRMWDDREARYRIYTAPELADLMAHETLEIINTDGINALPSLLFGGVLTKALENAPDKDALWKQIQKTEIGWQRQITYLTRKKA